MRCGTIGYACIARVARATGISRYTIERGLRELEGDTALPPGRSRRAGAGRKCVTRAPRLLADLEALVEPTAPGDPDSPLRWTCKSVRTLTVALELPTGALNPNFALRK